MPRYLIEREIPGAGQLTGPQLDAIIQSSNEVLLKMGPQIKWMQTYLTSDKFYCIFTAPNKELIMAHARTVGMPANNISEILDVLDPVNHPMHREKELHEVWYYA